MKSEGWLVLALLTCAACGGHSNREPTITSESPAAAGAASAGAPDDSAENGGAPTGQPASGGTGAHTGGADSDAGMPGYVPYIDSGTRWCESEDYCFGLDCYAPDTFEPSVCVAPCQSDADCAPYEACVQSRGLAPTCYARCSSPSDCEYHFDCFDFSGSGPFVCFPATWAGRRRELGN